MTLIKTIQELQKALAPAHAAGKTIGLVPTMGALHEGHLSLIRRAHAENDLCVVSVFVNPTQFNNAEDLQKYPRTLDADLALVGDLADIVFAPSAEEVYRIPATEHYDFGPVEQVMEGPARPGHFNGVGIIVKRLFDWVDPTRAYFGEKDYQQVAVVKTLVRQCGLKLEIVPCPIVREASGLALSSRNVRLSPEARKQALSLNHGLKRASAAFKAGCRNAEKLIWEAQAEIATEKDTEIQYISVANPDTLEIYNGDVPDQAIMLLAVKVGGVRLIDNMRLDK